MVWVDHAEAVWEWKTVTRQQLIQFQQAQQEGGGVGPWLVGHVNQLVGRHEHEGGKETLGATRIGPE